MSSIAGSWDFIELDTKVLASEVAAAELGNGAAAWENEVRRPPGVGSLVVEVGVDAASASGALLTIESKPGPSVGSKSRREAEMSAADNAPGNTRRRRRISRAITRRSTSRHTPTSTSTTSNVSDFS